MESVDCFVSGVPRASDANAAPAGGEWQSVPLEESLQPEAEYCVFVRDGKQVTENSRKTEYSFCGLSKVTSGDGAVDGTGVSKEDCNYISIRASLEDYSAVKEVRVTIHPLEDPKKCSDNVVYKTGNKVLDSAPLLGHGDDECLPLLQQVRAFIKGAKLSCTGLLAGDGKPFFNGWTSLLQRSFSFKSSETSSESESLYKKNVTTGISRTTSAPTPTLTICSTVVAETVKPSPLMARDPATRAEALPLAHYRPTDGVVWKEGDVKTGQSVPAAKSPVHANCKKPPKPPRHPGRSASLDSATSAAQRAARKNRERVFAKRKARGAANAAASTGLSPVVALVLTIAFGILMVFQGVFVQTNVSYGRNTESDITNVAANSRFSLPVHKADSFVSNHPIDRNLPASLIVEASNSEALLSGALQKSMRDLPWSRISVVQLLFSASCEHNSVISPTQEGKLIRSSGSIWEDYLDLPVYRCKWPVTNSILTASEHT
ncbi:unnamed protein product [Calypogeia fissa]